MKKIYFISMAWIFVSFKLGAQGISVNSFATPPDSSAMLDVSATNKGELMPRMSAAQRDAIVNPAMGLTIFNTDCHVYNYNAGTPANPDWATINASNVLTAGISISANPIGAICAGTNVTFTAIPSHNNLSPSYQWQVNGANVGTDTSVYTGSALNSGDVVTCILTSSAPCVTGSPASSNTITMLVNTVPTITGTSPASFCSGSAVTLGASASLGTINWYSDSTGGASLSSGASFTVSGLYSTTTYYVDATANGGTTALRTAVAATSYPSSPGQPGGITGPAIINRDSTGTYSINPLPNTSNYLWTISLGNVSSGQGTTSVGITWGDSSGVGTVSVVANNPCGSSVAQTIAVGVGIQTFSYTGGEQTFTVPAGITQLTFAVYGAQGGSVNSNLGGLGGYATGSLNVTPGEAIYIYVGNQPNGASGGFNGGGNGYNNGSGGGGASDVRVGGTNLDNRVIVAGGGGGTTFSWNCTGGTGGGQSGGSGSSSNGGSYIGAGGTQNGGGSVSPENCGGSSGSLGQGGNASDCDSDGGGGGGGYYGGGGSDAGGAGGGSGYISGVINGATQNGLQAGNGQIVITW